jgi:hypothetical protein
VFSMSKGAHGGGTCGAELDGGVGSVPEPSA